MIRTLLKTLCLLILTPLCLKAQVPTLKATVFTDQSEDTDYLAIGLEKGNLLLEDIREITFDVNLSDEDNIVYFSNVRDRIYTEGSDCDERTISVTVNNSRNITYTITTPHGLCATSRSSDNGNMNTIRIEAEVLLVSGVSSVIPFNMPHNIQVNIPSISYINCSNSGSGCDRVTIYDVDTEDFSKPTRPSGRGKVSANWHNQTAIYPNPATDILTLTSPTTHGLVNIFNTNGQLVYQDKIENYTQGIVTHNWQSGIYFVQIIDLHTQAIEQHKLNVVK